MIKSEKDKYLLIGLLGVLFAIISWFLVASPIKNKTEELKTQNVTLKQTADLYVEISTGIDEYKKRIENLTSEKEGILDTYPASIAREDQIMFWANMENTFQDQLAVSTLNMAIWEEVLPEQLTEPAPVVEETEDTATEDAAAEDAQNAAAAEPTPEDAVTQAAQEAAAAVHLYRAPMNFSYVATYRGLKNMINYLFSQSDKMNIENLNVAFDSATGNLAGNIDMNQFYLMGTDKQYTPAQIPTVSKGVSDVFHTVEGAALTPEETQEDTDTED